LRDAISAFEAHFVRHDRARGLQCSRTMEFRTALRVTSVVGLLLLSSGANAGSRLLLNVSPSIGMAPAYVVATITVERDADNRELEVAAESADFYRSSMINLDGDRAPRTNRVTWKDLPGGDYRIVAVLYGADGHRAMVERSVVITPSPLAR
jgi:hypothetical protein